MGKIKTQTEAPDETKEIIVLPAMGRPTKYDPSYCQALIDWFNVPHSRKEIKKQGSRNTVHKNGTETNADDVEFIYIPNELPTFAGFARKIGVDYDTLLNWCKTYPDFFGAYNISKQLQAEMLMDNALRGLYPPATFIFIAKNITDMRDKVEIQDTRQHEALEQMQKDLFKLLNPTKEDVKAAAGKAKAKMAKSKPVKAEDDLPEELKDLS